jgi:hypothetical protein
LLRKYGVGRWSTWCLSDSRGSLAYCLGSLAYRLADVAPPRYPPLYGSDFERSHHLPGSTNIPHPVIRRSGIKLGRTIRARGKASLVSRRIALRATSSVAEFSFRPRAEKSGQYAVGRLSGVLWAPIESSINIQISSPPHIINTQQHPRAIPSQRKLSQNALCPSRRRSTYGTPLVDPRA